MRLKPPLIQGIRTKGHPEIHWGSLYAPGCGTLLGEGGLSNGSEPFYPLFLWIPRRSNID